MTDPMAAFAAAEAKLTKALSSVPDHAGGHLWLRLVDILTKRAAEGIAECEHALALDRNLAQAHSTVGIGKIYVGRPEETEAHIVEGPGSRSTRPSPSRAPAPPGRATTRPAWPRWSAISKACAWRVCQRSERRRTPLHRAFAAVPPRFGSGESRPSIAQPVSKSPNSSQLSPLNFASCIWRIGL